MRLNNIFKKSLQDKQKEGKPKAYLIDCDASENLLILARASALLTLNLVLAGECSMARSMR